MIPTDPRMTMTLPRISAIISDLDGVAYRGETPIAEAVRAFRYWHEQGLPYAFVTNNSTRSAGEFAAKLNGMGIPATPDRIVTTSAAVAERLRETMPAGARVMVIGAPSLVAAVEARGFQIADTDVAAVVVGLDREFTFDKLQKAQTALLGGARFFGTNPDRMLPHGDGFEPGAGSILAAIETASGVMPLVIGKPQPDLIRMALHILGSDPATTFMLGDQIETDIIAGQAAGLKTILVRTGVPPRQVPGVHPDIDIASLSDLAFQMAHEGQPALRP
ncbi:HAD-IIA family hydrolase [Paracoccus acridae]|nr:HAD-IIA family hydrolase [Paracoccus acridae]